LSDFSIFYTFVILEFCGAVCKCIYNYILVHDACSNAINTFYAGNACVLYVFCNWISSCYCKCANVVVCICAERLHTLFRQTLFRQTLFRQSIAGTSTLGGWLQLNRPAGSTDWKTWNKIPKIRGRGSTAVLESWRYVVTFPEEGHLRPHRNTLPTPQAPLPSPPYLHQWRAFDACDALTPSNILPISTIPTYV